MFQSDQTVTGHRITNPPGMDTMEVGPTGDVVMDGRLYEWDSLHGRYVNQTGSWNYFIYVGEEPDDVYVLMTSQDPPQGSGALIHTGTGHHDGKN